MGKTLTNIAIALGLATAAFAGYYVYLQRESVPLDIAQSYDITEVLDRTNVFIEYRSKLNETELNVGLFEDKRFTTLVSYRKAIEEQPIGRPNPFAQSSKLPFITREDNETR